MIKDCKDYVIGFVATAGAGFALSQIYYNFKSKKMKKELEQNLEQRKQLIEDIVKNHNILCDLENEYDNLKKEFEENQADLEEIKDQITEGKKLYRIK